MTAAHPIAHDRTAPRVAAAALRSGAVAAGVVLAVTLVGGPQAMVAARGTAALAGALTIMCALVTPRDFSFVPRVYGAVVAVGALLEARLGTGGRGLTLLGVAAAGAYLAMTTLVRSALWRRLTKPGMAGWVGTGAVLVALALRFAPIIQGRLALASGQLALGPASLQIGEFTRPTLIVGVALVAWDAGLGIMSRTFGASHQVAQVAITGFAWCGYLAILASVDLGPALITAVITVAVLVQVLGPITWTARTRRAAGWALVAAVVAGLLLVTTNTLLSGRIRALWHPVGQAAHALNAMRSGGLLGGGIGSSPFAVTVPVAKSDELPAILCADLGALALGATIVALTTALAGLTVASRARRTSDGAIAFGLSLAMLIQTGWCLLAVLGVLPLTGLSVPGLVVTGSSVIPTELMLGSIVGLLAASGNARAISADPLGRTPAAATRRLARPVILVALVACLAVTLVKPAITTRDQILLPRGRILAATGAVIATSKDGNRVYPRGAEMADLGMLDQVNFAQYGLESTTANLLVAGGAANGAVLGSLLRPTDPTPADVVTTIYPQVQRAASDGIGEYRGEAAVLDATDGSLLALYSSQEPDPETWDQGPPPARSRLDWFAPGSTAKMITASAALIYGVSSQGAPTQLVPLPNGQSVQNEDGFTCGDPSINTMLIESCNTTAAFLGTKLGPSRLKAVADKYFGADRPLPYDGGSALNLSTGLTDATNLGDTARTAFGQQDMRANVLDMAVVGEVIAHSLSSTARTPAPRVIAGVCDGAKLAPVTERATVGPALPARVAKTVYAGMLGAVRGGTATGLATPGREIAAKTGTAEAQSADGAPLTESWVVAIVDHRWVIAAHIQLPGSVESSAAVDAAAQIVTALPAGDTQAHC
ncbi:MAG: penicillin-binding transpeptidase domain-containing protein [Actinomycetia bacterium]|nr:penicillin-binding transpeptidase domain-containing protein [Actinomycetes bacterium]